MTRWQPVTYADRENVQPPAALVECPCCSRQRAADMIAWLPDAGRYECDAELELAMLEGRVERGDHAARRGAPEPVADRLREKHGLQ